MKIYILVLFSIIFTTGYAGNSNRTSDKESVRLVSGKVIDKTSGEEIAGAEIRIADKILYTDLNGHFLVSIPVTTTDAKVSSVSYNETIVAIETSSYGEMLISLESK